MRFSTKPLPPRDRHKGIGQHLEADVFKAGNARLSLKSHQKLFDRLTCRRIRHRPCNLEVR